MAWLRHLDPPIKVAILLGIAAVGIALLAAIGPIDHSTYVDNFADGREICGVSNLLNVVSNLPFAIVGAIGIAGLRRRPVLLRPGLAVLYAGILLTGFGSGFHHLAPSFDRLLLDRLPMTLVFASTLAIAIGDRVNPRSGRLWLGPLVAIAVASVLYWYASGQLRPYAFVQGYPMIAIPAMLILYRGRHLDGRHFAAAVAIYAAALVASRLDAEIYELGNLVSGHTVKHLLAGWATWHLVAMCRATVARR